MGDQNIKLKTSYNIPSHYYTRMSNELIDKLKGFT